MPLNSISASVAPLAPLFPPPVQQKDGSANSGASFGGFDLEDEGTAASASSGDYSGPSAGTDLNTATAPSSDGPSASPLPEEAPDPSSLTGAVYNSVGQLQSLSSNAGRSLNLSV